MRSNKLKLWGIVVAVAMLAFGAVGYAADVSVDPSANDYYAIFDIVRGSKNATGPSCVKVSEFQKGEQVVWRADIYDRATGEKMTQDAIEARGIKAYAQLVEKDANGQFVSVKKTYDMKYSNHGRSGPEIWFWTAAWQIPPVYPTGIVYYRLVIVDKDGHAGVVEPIASDLPGGHSSLLQVVDKE